MVKHLSIRLAWHDSNWNGCVCERPEENVYCVGSHSLLSERLARERNIDIEKAHPGQKMDTLGDYIPPKMRQESIINTHLIMMSPKSLRR